MSDFGEEIIDRLHENCSLRQTNNPMRKIIDKGVGSWFDNFEDTDFFNMFFLDTAIGNYLDLWGKEFNVIRNIGETDDDYRQRIILESLGHLTRNYLQNVYNFVLYCYVENFDASNNMLTSDNPYLCNNYMVIANEEMQNILRKKFVVGSELTFIEVE